MKLILNIVLVILVFLAISSGIAKILLMTQEVDVFGQYGFTNPILISFGVLQLLGGTLLIPVKTRIIGALIVGLTFLASAVVLGMAGQMPLAVATLICVALLGLIIYKTVGTKELAANASSTTQGV